MDIHLYRFLTSAIILLGIFEISSTYYWNNEDQGGYCMRGIKEVCCAGYSSKSVKPLVCRPICRPECSGAYCRKPGVCQCFENYVRESKNVCKPICVPSCVNGTCVRPFVCQCLAGHREVRFGVCEPTCEPLCQNADCVSPNSCRCWPSYSPDPSSLNSCQPICTPPCVNATCSSPQNCSCLPGYHPSKQPNICQPHCKSGCSNGYCTAPDICECNEGFEKSNETGICSQIFSAESVPENEGKRSEVKSSCDKECVGGYCSDGDMCQCFNGFELAEDGLSCIPTCSEICLNGDCTGPDNCSCYHGFEKQDHNPFLCKPICEGGCQNGECVEPNHCKCDHHYLLHPLNPSVCLMTFDELTNTQPTSTFLQTFFISNGLFSQDDNGFFLSSDIMFTIKKECSSLMDVINQVCSLTDCMNGKCQGISLDCIPIHNKTTIFCEWKNDLETENTTFFEDEMSLNQSDMRNVIPKMQPVIVDNNTDIVFKLTGLQIIIEFPEYLAAVEPGNCQLRLCQTKMKLLNLGERISLQIVPIEIAEGSHLIKYYLLLLGFMCAIIITILVTIKCRRRKMNYEVERSQATVPIYDGQEEQLHLGTEVNEVQLKSYRLYY